MKVLFVLGTRPEGIKLAPVVAALRRRRVATVVCSTGQHRELLSDALAGFGLEPDVDLRLMRRGQSPLVFARRAERALAKVLARVKPALVVVQGDTASALAGALAAAARGVPVAHVEAGLRSFDPKDPYPEEVIRVVVDHLSTMLFPPTAEAARNLRAEGLSPRTPTGNTVVDALRTLARGPRRVRLPGGTREVLVTLHRRESYGRPLERMVSALRALLDERKDLVVVFPAHPNPKVRSAVKRLAGHPRAVVTRPFSHAEFVDALLRCDLLVTDSGGAQEEAAALGVPVLVAREKTERPEIPRAGAGVVVGRSPRALLSWTRRLLSDDGRLSRMGRARALYGDGRAAERVAAAIAGFR